MTRKQQDPSAQPPPAQHHPAQHHPAPPKVPADQQPAPGHHPAPHHGKSTGPISPRLFATMERSALDQLLAGLKIVSGPGGTVFVLSQDPAEVDAITFPLARIANTLLPLWQLAPVQMGIFKRQMYPNLGSLANNVANSLRILAQGNITFNVKSDQLQDLMKKVGVYESYKLVGMQTTNVGMDQRQVSGSFLVFLVDRVLTVLDRRFNDQNLSQQAKDRLLEHFGPALVELDEVLRNPVLRRQELAAHRADLAQQAQDAAKEAQLKETSLRVRQKLVLPREMLFAAARRYVMKAQQQQNPGVLSDQPTVTPPPPPTGPHTPRKILQ